MVTLAMDIDRDAVLAALMSAPRKETAARRLVDLAEAIAEARANGVRWADIVQRLASAGITRPDGRPLAVSTVIFAMRRLEERCMSPTRRPAAAPVKHCEAVPPAGVGRQPDPRPPPAESDFVVPPEVEALLQAPADAPPVHTIDDLLKELKK